MESRKAIVRHVKDLTFIAKAGSNHWTTVDSSHHGNMPAATSPMELILIALGACTGSDVVSILEKKRARLVRFEVAITGVRAKEYPKVYTEIHLEYRFSGEGMREKDVKHAIELSMTKYCSVSAMLKKSVHVTYSYAITKGSAETTQVD